jgi:hypothetical protein
MAKAAPVRLLSLMREVSTLHAQLHSQSHLLLCLLAASGAASAICSVSTPPALLLQLLVINVEDQDFRDLLFDYRITRAGIK